MRTTKELIDELKEKAKGCGIAALIVGFEDTTLFIKSNEADALQHLNDAIDHGGEPVGWYRVNPTSVEIGLLAEYEDKEWAQAYIEKLGSTIESAIGQDIFGAN